MSDTLATYLHDHLAASNFAIELLKHLHEQHAREPLGTFVAGLLKEVEQDRQSLQRIVEAVGSKESGVKEMSAWVGEKVSRFKLSHSSSGDAGTFQALETMALGVLGKLALWQALAVVAPSDLRLSGTDFEALAARAQTQHAQVEEWRLQFAPKALRPAAD